MHKKIIFSFLWLILLSCAHAQVSWYLTGNSNATSSNFIGTTNDTPLYFKTSNTLRMSLLSDKSFLGIGTSTPIANLHIHSLSENAPRSANVLLMTNSFTGATINNGFKIIQNGKSIGFHQLESANFSILNNGSGIIIDTLGYVGFNTSFPKQKIHVVDNNILISKTSYRAPGSTNGSLLFGGIINDNNPFGSWGIEYVNDDDAGYGLNFWKTWEGDDVHGFNYALFLSNNGNVGIGTNNPLAKLTVNGNICAKEVRVSLSGSPCWPDYVFESDYKLLPLTELKSYITQNKHLPNIPTAKEIEGAGIELGEMNATLLRKIEELTLYIIDLQKQLDELKNKGGE